jgi:hypothetical protein
LLDQILDGFGDEDAAVVDERDRVGEPLDLVNVMPDVGRSRFSSILIVVVLPAPFGPTNAKRLPAGT